MAIELKGIKGKALKFASVLERVNSAYDMAIETGTEHAADVEGIVKQLANVTDDMTFAAQVLGNSSAVSGKSETETEKQKSEEKTSSQE